MADKNLIKSVIVLLFLSNIFGCRLINMPENLSDATFTKDMRLQFPDHLPDLSLTIIKTADWKSLEALLYSGGSWIESRTNIHSAVLIQHPHGSVLFDSGLGHHIDTQFFSGMPFWLKPFMAYENHLPAIDLLATELKSRPIQAIILSHLHWDHISGIEDFHDIEIWTTKEEYEWTMNQNTLEAAFIKSHRAREDIRWRFIEFESGPYENFEQSFDVFKDGSLVLVPLPGHTPGSIGMFVNLRSGKKFFFTGDATWALEGFQMPAHKFWLSGLMADHNKEKTEQTILKVHQLIQEYPEMFVVPAHDDKVQSAIGFYPKFIR